jgi:C4-dicarboxylate-specific signal transduction histidine kinase
MDTLEDTVAERTKELSVANGELSQTLAVLQRAQKELLESEKLASLGRLVAGIAHELNTPIGNSVTVSTSLTEKVKRFKLSLSGGTIKKSTFNEFTDNIDHGTRLLASSLNQAAELIHSFKQVAVDQTSSLRRHFDLKTVTDEVLITLHPRLKKTTHKVRVDIPDGLQLDSFPGPYGQVIVNVIQNALIHAFEGRENGSIKLSANCLEETGSILLQVCDDGCGMTEPVVNRVFEPFFTTKLGKGGSGLGMNIVYNIVTGILGGKIHVQSTLGNGTCFIIELPVVAPKQNWGETNLGNE